MSLHMTKIQRLSLFIGLSVFALTIGLGGCLVYMDSIDDVRNDANNGANNKALRLPVGKVINNGVEVLPGADYHGRVSQFVLTWKSPESPDGPLNDADPLPGSINDGPNVMALKDLHRKWKEYARYMISRPYFPYPDNIDISENVWDGSELINKNSSGWELRILRYWPRDLLEKGQPLTVSSWYGDPVNNVPSSNARREADFLKAKEQIEAQMRAIKASPFWDVWYWQSTDDKCYPLQDMWQEMRDFISTGEIPDEYLYKNVEWAGYYKYVTDPDLDSHPDSMKMLPRWDYVGDLYTVYFGPIPGKDDYRDDTGPFVFPVE